MAGLRRDLQGVSDVVGQVLMLAVTVTVFAGLGILVMGVLEEDARTGRADLRVVRGEDNLLLRHQGGDDLPLDELTLLLDVDGVPTRVPGTDLAGQVADGTTWRVGGSLCITCHYPGQPIANVRLLQGNALVLQDHDEEPVGGAHTLAALRAASVQATPTAPGKGEEVVFSGTVANDGASTTNVLVRFMVGSTKLGDTTIAGLAEGATATVTSPTWTATVGDHVVQVLVDPADTIPEEDEGDNSVSMALHVPNSVADPGAPFEDTDGDLRYTEGTDVLLTSADVADGIHDAGVNGLVLPPSVGPISAGAIDLRGAALRIEVDLTSTGQQFDLVATGDITFTAVATAQAGGSDVFIQAGGEAVLTGSRIDSLTTDVSGSALRANGTTFIAANGKVLLGANGDMDLESAHLEASRDLEATVVSGATVRVDQAVIIDRDGLLLISPADANVTGTPAQGGWTT